MPSQPLVERPSDVLQSFLVHQESSTFNSVVSERGQVQPCVVPAVTFHDHLIVLPIAGQLRTNFCPDGFTTEQHTCRAGNIAIYPAGTSTQCTIETNMNYHYNCLQLKTEAVSQMVSEVIDISQFELNPHFGLADPLLQQILGQIGSGLDESSPLDRLYVDSLANTLFVHLLQNYTTRKPVILQYNDGLSPYQLRRVIDYIQTHLTAAIKLADLANLLGMSQYYFARLFRLSMGIPPYQYVIQLRVEKAKQQLRQLPQISIAAIALDCGFTSQSSLCKHFRNLTGTTPKAYRRDVCKGKT